MMRAGWALLACATACASSRQPTAAKAPLVEREPEAHRGAPAAPLAWADLDAATFARARTEKRFLVIDGSAEWCHWCHVMEATSYHDPDVRKILDARFIAVKVDVDTRPDFQERYQDWGWPATVLMTPDGKEIGKYKGYLPPERFIEILTAVAEAPVEGAAGRGVSAGARRPATLDEAGVAAVEATARGQLETFWDPEQGSWGRTQKVPLYWDNAWGLSRARAGDGEARRRALFTLDRQRGIVDPVWGGICQYSTDGDWRHPHYEKLMTYEAGAIDNYATAYALTRDAAWLRTAEGVRGFVDGFLRGPEGGFYATMDADLNSHEPDKPFVAGHEYYARSDAERRALGIPRVDTHEYGRENGLAIAAYVTLWEASGDATVLETAKRAAARVLSTHASDRGGITHAAGDDGRVLYLADNAAFGFALARLHEATRDPQPLEAARRIGDFIVRELADPDGGFYASTPDTNAVGVFAVRRKPFEDNVMAVRLLARLARLLPSDTYRSAIARALAVVGTREAIEDRGRMLGDLLLALDETRAVR
ncbi:MAG: DUF255 domain-containing protein [Polyangiaceae bacterium]